MEAAAQTTEITRGSFIGTTHRPESVPRLAGVHALFRRPFVTVVVGNSLGNRLCSSNNFLAGLGFAWDAALQARRAAAGGRLLLALSLSLFLALSLALPLTVSLTVSLTLALTRSPRGLMRSHGLPSPGQVLTQTLTLPQPRKQLALTLAWLVGPSGGGPREGDEELLDKETGEPYPPGGYPARSMSLGPPRYTGPTCRP